MGVVLDPGGGAGDFAVAGEFDVVHRVVADLVAFGEDPAHRRFAARHLLADLEEGPGRRRFSRSTSRKPGVYSLGPSSKVRATTWRSRGPLVTKPGAAAGAADRAHRAQAEGVGGVPEVGQRIATQSPAAPAAAAVARRYAPAVAAGAEAGVARGPARATSLSGSGRLSRAGTVAPFGHLAGASTQLQAERAGAASGAAEAEPPFRAAARARRKREAEVGETRPRAVRARVELRQRHRPRGPHRRRSAPAPPARGGRGRRLRAPAGAADAVAAAASAAARRARECRRSCGEALARQPGSGTGCSILPVSDASDSYRCRVRRPVRARRTPVPGSRLALLAIARAPRDDRADPRRRRPPKPAAPENSTNRGHALGNTAFDRQGMWVWYVDHSEGGSIAAIVARAKAQRHRHRLRQGGRRRQRLEPVQPRPGRRRCTAAGSTSAPGSSSTATPRSPRPRSPPRRSRKGADCFVIDAEGDYEGKYAAADRYVRALRARIGADLPGLARRLPLRRLPPVLPLLGLLRAGRRPVQPAADVLEDDRHLGADRLRAHLPLQPHLGPPDLPDRPDLRRPRRRPRSALFRRFAAELRRPAAELVGLAGDERRRSGGRSARPAPCGRSPATGSKSSTRC